MPKRNYEIRGYKSKKAYEQGLEFNYLEDMLTKSMALEIGQAISKKYAVVLAIRRLSLLGSYLKEPIIAKKWTKKEPTTYCVLGYENEDDRDHGEYRLCEDEIETKTQALESKHQAQLRYPVVVMRQGPL